MEKDGAVRQQRPNSNAVSVNKTCVWEAADQRGSRHARSVPGAEEKKFDWICYLWWITTIYLSHICRDIITEIRVKVGRGSEVWQNAQWTHTKRTCECICHTSKACFKLQWSRGLWQTAKDFDRSTSSFQHSSTASLSGQNAYYVTARHLLLMSNSYRPICFILHLICALNPPSKAIQWQMKNKSVLEKTHSV